MGVNTRNNEITKEFILYEHKIQPRQLRRKLGWFDHVARISIKTMSPWRGEYPKLHQVGGFLSQPNPQMG
jgi:hypothetical protein